MKHILEVALGDSPRIGSLIKLYREAGGREAEVSGSLGSIPTSSSSQLWLVQVHLLRLSFLIRKGVQDPLYRF